MTGHQLSCVAVLLLSLVVSPVSAHAGDEAPPGVDPRADQVLRQMSQLLADTSQFTFEASQMMDEVADSGQKLQFSSTRRIAVRRPDRAMADHTGDYINQRAYYDGKTLTIIDETNKVYSRIKVPATIDAMLDYLAEHYGTTMPLADLLLSDPYKMVIGAVRSGDYLGRHQVFATECHHLAFRQDLLDWQIWIQADGPPLPRKLVITYKSLPGQPQYIAFLNNWNLKPELSDEQFSAMIPDGFREEQLKPAVTDDDSQTRSRHDNAHSTDQD